MSQQFVAIVYQGLVTDQKALAVGSDEQALQQQADDAASKINAQLQGETEGWTAAVLPVGA